MSNTRMDIYASWTSELTYEAPPPFEVTTERLGPQWITRSLTLPLWLLAATCLVWPVTSFIYARRRRKEPGFAVKPAANAAPPDE